MLESPVSTLLSADCGGRDAALARRVLATVQRPTVVGVGGRAGAGRRTVMRTLRSLGVAVGGPGDDVDIELYVFVETLTRDDRAALAMSRRPVVAVLNKAELTGFRRPDPIADAADRCRDLQRETAVPVCAMSALLALAGGDPAVLDDKLFAEMRTAGAANRRLVATLGAFGAHYAVTAAANGCDAAAVRKTLLSLSGVAQLSAAISQAGAAPRYRRLVRGLTELGGSARAVRFGTSDRVVLARAAAALAVVEADGVARGAPTTRTEYLREAVRWQRYGSGPVSELHRRCATDIARAMMRRWTQAGGRPVDLP